MIIYSLSFIRKEYMLKQEKTSKRGFTIIEVVLVLAIAGLIFLMVFLALPALQRSQRDTERRNKLGEFRTQIVQYQSNNSGRVPKSLSDWQRIVDDYLNLSRTKNGGYSFNTDGDKTWTDDDIPFLDPDGDKYYIAFYMDLADSKGTSEKVTLESDDNDKLSDKLTLDKDGKVPTTGLTWDDNKHQIYVFGHARCDGDNVLYQEHDSDRLVAFVTKLEGAGVYCGEN